MKAVYAQAKKHVSSRLQNISADETYGGEDKLVPLATFSTVNCGQRSSFDSHIRWCLA